MEREEYYIQDTQQRQAVFCALGRGCHTDFIVSCSTTWRAAVRKKPFVINLNFLGRKPTNLAAYPKIGSEFCVLVKVQIFLTF